MFIFLHLFAAAYMPRKGKVPKRINKAVRERIICEHLNELFIELANFLGIFSIDFEWTSCEAVAGYILNKMVLALVLTMNVFFFSELNQQNSGRVLVLCEATQFLKDVFGQIESLINGHTCLLSDSNYVSHFLRSY